MIPSLPDLKARFEALVAKDPIPPPPPPPPAPEPVKPAATAPAEGTVAPTPAAAPTPPPAPIAPPPQVQETDFAKRGFHLDVRIKPTQVLESAQLMNEHGFTLELVTGVDWLAQNEMEVVYDYLHFHTCCRVAVRVRVPRAEPQLPTIREVHPGADWHERETHEFFGIKFLGHPNLTPLLLPEDATFHPLRKDFAGA